MEGCGTWTDLFNGCLGRRHETEGQSVVLTPHMTPYGRILMDRLEEDAGKRVHAGGKSQDGLPGRELTKVPLDNSRRPSQDLGELANNENKVPVDDREYDDAWHEMLDSLHNALKHTRYSVSGRMAMSVWGCSRGARDALSVICPVESKDAVKIWAVSTGGRFTMTDAEPDILIFRSQGSSSSRHHGEPRLWRIRIRWFPERMFEAMPKVEKRLTYHENPYTGEYRIAHVNVLTLPALLDNSASAWVDNLAKVTSQEQLDAVAQDVVSILDRIMELNFQEEGSGPLSAAESRHVLDKAFWIPFTHRYSLVQAKFAQCGLGLPSYTRNQPSPHDGMVYPEDLPHSSPAASTKDNGRSLMARNLRKPVPRCRIETETTETPAAVPESPVWRPSFRGLFSITAGEEAKEAQRERKHQERDDTRQLEEQDQPGALEMEGRDKGRKGERRVRWEDKEEKEDKEETDGRKGSKSRRKRSRRSVSRPGPSSSRSVHRSATLRGTCEEIH